MKVTLLPPSLPFQIKDSDTRFTGHKQQSLNQGVFLQFPLMAALCSNDTDRSLESKTVFRGVSESASEFKETFIIPRGTNSFPLAVTLKQL